MSNNNNKDNWKHKSTGMQCRTCMYFVPKAEEGKITEVGRCRKHAPTLEGWPVMFLSDWCGDHKLDADKLDADKLFVGNPNIPYTYTTFDKDRYPIKGSLI